MHGGSQIVKKHLAVGCQLGGMLSRSTAMPTLAIVLPASREHVRERRHATYKLCHYTIFTAIDTLKIPSLSISMRIFSKPAAATS